MTAGPCRNVAASVHRRLVDRANERDEDVNDTLQRYVLERFLFRLSRSRHAGSFALKGAMLFAVWEGEPHRPTRDIDLLGFDADSIGQLRDVFAEVCAVEVDDDGVVFDAATVAVGDVRGAAPHTGKRVLIECRLGNARHRVQVDVGFGDALARPPVPTTVPALLGFPAPRLFVYPVEAVIAEKLHAMAEYGALSSRMKDMFDVVALAERLEFDGAELTAAIHATFESRGRQAGEVPPPISPEFAGDGAAVARWGAFMRRSRLGPLDLATAVERARAFLFEPLAALRAGEMFAMRWPPGGPWQ